MADAAAAAAPAPAPAKKAPKKKASKPKVPAAHPTYAVMVAKAIGALKERKGSSKQAILKYITANFKVGNEEKKVNARVKIALRSGVVKGALKQTKGAGASGSFRLAEKVKVAKAAKPKKPAAKKAKKPKKPAAAKPKKAKSPKKAKKPAAVKKAAKPKKTKSPKKAKKPAAKKPAAKKAAKKAAPKKK